jgi:NADPH-dependent 2,4-dienoyl-CoA reductase/sulfur reductase-like enzyme
VERLVVVGGDAAGMSAASQARRLRPDDLTITAFERGPFTSYSACGIPYLVGTAVERVEDLIVRTPEQFGEQGIDARIRHEVTEIDVTKGAIKVKSGSEPERWEGFDQLVYATGAVPVRPSLPGVDSEGIFGVQTLDHGLAIKRFMDERRPRRAVVVGGGYIGLEMAEAFRGRDLDVTLVEAQSQVMSTIDPDMGELVAEAMRRIGISVRTREPVHEFEVKDGRVVAVVTPEGYLAADIVVLGLGVRPNVELARAAGIPLGPAGGVAVDRRMRTSLEGVWAAGDCAEKWHRVARSSTVIPLGTHANKEGRVAGINVAGGYATFPGVIGTAASRVCDIEIGRTGLLEREARAAGLEPLSVTVDSTTRAGYFPGSEPIKTKMIVEKRTGRLLGAQIIGREGAAKRIDVLATALWNDMAVGDFLNMDLAYAPPFSPVWDPVLVAARKASQRVEETMPEVH